jgi:hypothetical protein
MLGSRFDRFRRNRTPVQAGSVYTRRGHDATVETAEVLSVQRDGQGIPHVRFHISIRRGNNAMVDEDRILNLDAFADRFREHVPA